MSDIRKSITELVGHTPMVELTNFEAKHHLHATLIGKLEYLNPAGSVKDRAALNMIKKGEREGKLKPGGTIVESTSGNTGISLAAFAAARQIAERPESEGKNIVIILPDDGMKYLSTKMYRA